MAGRPCFFGTNSATSIAMSEQRAQLLGGTPGNYSLGVAEQLIGQESSTVRGFGLALKACSLITADRHAAIAAERPSNEAIINGKRTTLPPYGCHNRPPINSIVWHSTGQADWPHVMSTDCRYDLSHGDARCAGCRHVRAAA